MGRLRTITRRSFLVGSAAVLGGVAFGTYVAKRPQDNPLTAGLREGEAAFTAYIKITADRITLIAPHADKGQGAQSAQVMLIAEELDVEPDQVEVSFGHPAPAYYNTALADGQAPFMPFDQSLTARTVRTVMGVGTKALGVMATGGSTTIPDSYTKLRVAGAVARETLKRAASGQTGIAVDQLTTARGAVILPDGTALSYTALAVAAAGIEPVQQVTLRDPSEWRLIGRPAQRLDIVAKSTGTQRFGIDRKIDGMVHAALRLNPRKGGEMRSYDASLAKDMRGVQAIVQIEGAIWELDRSGKPFARRGPVGVAVIADNTWRAFQAADAISIDWAPAPYPAEMEAHWAAVEESFTEDRREATWRDEGDTEAALAQGSVIEAEYRAPYVAHQPLEPLNAIIRVDSAGAEVWAGHQMLRFAQQKIARAAGLDDPESVIFHNQFIGGSFGHRLEFDFLIHAAEIARQLPGVPVKLTYRREEDFAQDFTRQISMARMRGRVAGGRVDTYAADIASVSAIGSQTARLGLPAVGPDQEIPAGIWTMPLAIPNLRVRAYRVPGLAPVSSWRSVGASSAGFFGESFMDELCHAAGADPMEERLRLVTNDVHRQVLEAVADLCDWGCKLGPGRGRGLALVESFGVPAAEVVDVTATEDGIRIDTVYVAADVGRIIDPVNFDAQMRGGVIWGLGHAMNCEITYSDGMAEQSNFDSHEGMRMSQTPEIFVRGLENAEHIRGIGEPPVPPAAPALANAIFAATGQRLREMPFNKFIDFV
ncbi:xanthine dehydrogenase family protein molybdopterin-binding subunit [Roseovarius faecimaris]|uniref:Xanthine dehydrogenase family protein molybdopterin-binding subunit n=1 Tax=Roseovarius faecimaris TaxID=2494550 RepID=A0A6I6IXP7_9RHOB|nr:molybdopterin cofactor-binding domain-containing protein [Roseovarius faecimaris]QGY00228.1 xanthine dehydrogenase family protein molybdopterin-binding subunit [Roseovarius faecimaris]